MLKMLIGPMIVIALSLAAAGLAVAQVAAPETAPATLDFGPLLQMAVDYIAVALGAVLLWLFNRFAAPLMDEHLAETARNGLDLIIRRGIRLAADRLEVSDRLGAVAVKNDLIREAAAYVIASAPGWVAKFNLGPDRLADMVRARLGEEIASIEIEADPGVLLGETLVQAPVPA